MWNTQKNIKSSPKLIKKIYNRVREGWNWIRLWKKRRERVRERWNEEDLGAQAHSHYVCEIWNASKCYKDKWKVLLFFWRRDFEILNMSHAKRKQCILFAFLSFAFVIETTLNCNLPRKLRKISKSLWMSSFSSCFNYTWRQWSLEWSYIYHI
jgi:hypothetical protein